MCALPRPQPAATPPSRRARWMVRCLACALERPCGRGRPAQVAPDQPQVEIYVGVRRVDAGGQPRPQPGTPTAPPASAAAVAVPSRTADAALGAPAAAAPPVHIDIHLPPIAYRPTAAPGPVVQASNVIGDTGGERLAPRDQPPLLSPAVAASGARRRRRIRSWLNPPRRRSAREGRARRVRRRPARAARGRPRGNRFLAARRGRPVRGHARRPRRRSLALPGRSPPPRPTPSAARAAVGSRRAGEPGRRPRPSSPRPGRRPSPSRRRSPSRPRPRPSRAWKKRSFRREKRSSTLGRVTRTSAAQPKRRVRGRWTL